jgi:hypothetical protein
LDTAPTDVASSVMTSLFQTDKKALRAERYWAYELLRTLGVSKLTGATW